MNIKHNCMFLVAVVFSPVLLQIGLAILWNWGLGKDSLTTIEMCFPLIVLNDRGRYVLSDKGSWKPWAVCLPVYKIA